MNEFITGIRVIKMYGWENPFKKITAAIRRYVSLLESIEMNKLVFSLFLHPY